MLPRPHLAAFLLLLMSSSACVGDAVLDDSSMEALVWLDDTGIDIESVDPAERPELPAWSDRMLHFALYDGGDVLVEGDVPDPRFLRSETTAVEEDVAGEAPLEVAGAEATGGYVSLFLPAVAGELVLTDADGVEIGRERYEPPPEGAARAPLVGPSDVRGRPARVVRHGTKADKIDILFVAEGYRQGELATFRSDVARIVDALSNKADYDGRRWDWFNVWRQNVRSAQSGADDPMTGRQVVTAFDTSYGVGGAQRCLFPETRAGLRAAHRLRRQARADVVVVLVNSSQYGGCAGGGVITQSRRGSPARVLAHELGHAVFGLADEYDYGRSHCGATRRAKLAPNVSGTDDRRDLPWSDLVGSSTRVPTPATSANARVVGAFEGAMYCPDNRWRPQLNCLMRELHHTMCLVCSRQMGRVARRIRDGQTRGGRSPEETGPICGDGSCDGDESCEVCEDDCGVCEGGCEGPRACTDADGNGVCVGDRGITSCADGYTWCTCTMDGFASCDPCMTG